MLLFLHRNDGKGHFVPPAVFATVRDKMRIAQEEIFGPEISFKDADELVKRVNAIRFGLGGGVWRRDLSKAYKCAKAIRAGSAWGNCCQAMDPAVPFGGDNIERVEEYLNVKAVWIETT